MYLVNKLLSQLLGILMAFFDWIMSTAGCWVLDQLCTVLGLIPDDYLPALESMAVYLQYLANWVPIQWGMILFQAYVLFLIAFIVIKFIWKLIPTTG